MAKTPRIIEQNESGKKGTKIYMHIHIHIRIHINERGQKGFYIYSSCPFSGKRRVRDSYENGKGG